MQRNKGGMPREKDSITTTKEEIKILSFLTKSQTKQPKKHYKNLKMKYDANVDELALTKEMYMHISA